MSLLPQAIPPENVAIGRLQPDGTVVIDHTWWLLLYNLVKNVLGTQGTTNLDILIEDTRSDEISSNTDALRRPIANLEELVNLDVAPSAPPDQSWLLTQDLSDPVNLAAALLWAQEATPPTPAPQAPPIKAVTPTGSPFTYTAPANGTLAVFSGTVSAIALIRQGTTVTTNLTSGLIPVSRLDQVQITYTGAPTVNFLGV